MSALVCFASAVESPSAWCLRHPADAAFLLTAPEIHSMVVGNWVASNINGLAGNINAPPLGNNALPPQLRLLHTTHKTAKNAVIFRHSTAFCHNCNDFFNRFLYGQRLSLQFFDKNLCSFVCCVCKAIYTIYFNQSVLLVPSLSKHIIFIAMIEFPMNCFTLHWTTDWSFWFVILILTDTTEFEFAEDCGPAHR